MVSGHFAPWAIRPQTFRPMDVGRNVQRLFAPKTFRLTRTLALFPLDTENRRGKKKERKKKKETTDATNNVRICYAGRR